ncbi:hypothetical protein G210_1405 [Candida maltosa Xu316]|uniref:tRNA(Ile)-lysidine synthetase n=1 Tax=Candida maltosa (strain Xu316) TaxID=1245528 RepID=M3INX1_CANMX|nr:hypothetical protein G210_1405 [Candida maltosa Xu316]
MIINDTLFEHGLNSLFRSRLPTKVAVALSGGPDSMLLTWLLHKHKINHNAFDIYAITIDHKYRRESRREALRVHDYVKNWELKHIIKELDYDEGTDPTSLKNFEEVARTKRYEAFAEVCYQESIPAIFVGHHKDDQLETFIQRLQGNSTIFGLAGTRRISALPVAKDLPPQADNHPQLRVVRPFYNYDKQDIFDTCAVNDLQFVNDPTNLDINLTRRNYLRHMIGDILPEKAKPNSPYEIIDRPSLEQSHASCLEFATLFEEKAHNLSMYLQENNLIETYPSMGSMKIEFPRVCFDPETTVVTFARWQVRNIQNDHDEFSV